MPKIDLTGVVEKLKRAKENIINLNSEISAFLNDGYNSVLPKDNDEVFQKAVDEHDKRKIPERFSVLTGEIVHHLRSCLDHVVWQLSSTQAREKPRNVEFPVCSKPFTDEDELAIYERKVKGITSPRAKAIIRGFQQNQRPEPFNDPLWIVHDLDRVDKHQNLVIVSAGITLHMDIEALTHYLRIRQKGDANPETLELLEREVDMNAKFTTQIAFAQFGGRKTESVIKGLTELANYVENIVMSFVGIEV